MHIIRDYSNSPAKAFDAVQDIIEWLGNDKYNEISPMISHITDCQQFSFYCMLAGIQGFPVKAWYEHYHGQGSWVEPKED